MKSFARNISTMAAQKTLESDVRASYGVISENTVSTYINALERIFVIENTPAWNTSLRSKTAAIRTSPEAPIYRSFNCCSSIRPFSRKAFD